MEKPFRLDEGIYFEDTKQMLFWNESFEKIQKIDNPEITNNGDTLKWMNKTCFGGQKLDIIISKNDYDNRNRKLEFANFEEPNETMESLYETSKKYSIFFKEYFGEPNEIKVSYGRKTELWNFDDMQIIIGVGERFTDFLIFGIHKGVRFWNLSE